MLDSKKKLSKWLFKKDFVYMITTLFNVRHTKSSNSRNLDNLRNGFMLVNVTIRLKIIVSNKHCT